MYHFAATTFGLLLLSGLASAKTPNVNQAGTTSNALDIVVTGPSSVSSVSDLEFTAKVTNIGGEPIKVLKYATVLDELPTRSFVVRKAGDDTEIEFIGVKLSVSLRPEEGADKGYTSISAGETITVKHKLNSLYDFAAAGPGSYIFEPIASFQASEPVDTNLNFSAKAPSHYRIQATYNTVAINITGDLGSRAGPSHEKRASPIVCFDADKNAYIAAAYRDSIDLSYIGSTYIATYGGATTEYQQYFDSRGAAGSLVVTLTNRFLSIQNDESSTLSRILSCTDDYGVCGNGGVIAYTVIATKNIYFCPLFFTFQPLISLCRGTDYTSRNTRGATMLHEMTHSIFNTADVNYGCSANKALPDSQKSNNADSYGCFASQILQVYRCTSTGPWAGFPIP